MYVMYGRRYDEIEARYQRSFGVRAGYLPQDRTELDQWQAELSLSLRSADLPEKHQEAVQKLDDLLKSDPIVRMYVHEMIEQAQHLPAQENRPHIVKDVPELLAALDGIVREVVPVYKKIAFPMSALFVYMMMTPAGEAAFRNERFNNVLREILTDWCKLLDCEKSRCELKVDPGGWLSPEAVEDLHLDDYVTEEDKKELHWGFKSWNDFFHREIRDGKRPLSGAGDSTVIVSANDGHVYNFATKVKAYDTFWAKGQPYSLCDMLKGKHNIDLDQFIGGDVIQSFLSGNDYHRFVAPIDGTVTVAEIVPGLMFSDAESAGPDPGAGVLSQGYEVAVNTRGLVFIKSPEPNIGTVCVIPIGITEVSSIKLVHKNGTEIKKNDVVRKGDQLGYFSFGGSTLCMVFQPNVIVHYTLRAPEVGDTNAGPPGSINSIIKAKEQIARTRELTT